MRTLTSYIACILLVCSANRCMAQEAVSKKPAKTARFILYAGLGPNFYFNNLVLAKDEVNEFNYAFVARFMWEPEYFLSIGFETGYNKLYTVSAGKGTANELHIVNAAIPLQGVVSMKFLKHFYGNFTMGQSILLNKVSRANKEDDKATTFSLSDFGLAFGYRKPVGEKWYLGTELKGYYSTKLNDKNIGLVFMAGYRF